MKFRRQCKKYGVKILVLCFWLLLWEILSRVVNKEILLAPPIAVIQTLGRLSMSLSFWQTILFSSARIILGFLLALILGIAMAILSYRSRIFFELISPMMKVIKATPVASFIILALIWIHSKNLSILISFLMVLPLIFTNILQGIRSTDGKLLQMAKVFKISWNKKITAIYVPAVIPYFISACSVGLGFCWKAGIAAEVIGLSTGSIGWRLYEAKLYWMTKELFAWTIVIIIISILFEKLVMQLIKLIDIRGGDPQ